MSRLAWGTAGTRTYEAGTDRGVLYVDGLVAGIAWNGLTAVRETPTGGDPQAYYLDGFKYLNVAGTEEFEASIEAFSSPLEFGVCDGTSAIANGLFATQQPRKPFGMSYRTGIGNDIDGQDHGYKIHLVYNALAKPASRANTTIGDQQAPLKLTWAITTTPKRTVGYKPTAHFVVDSRLTPEPILSDLEDIIYGTDVTQPRLPLPEELLEMFAAYLPLTITDLGDGEYSAEGSVVRIATPATFTITHESIEDNGDGSFIINY